MSIESLLDSALEHSSHAWRALEVAGLTPEMLDGPWPPNVSDVGGAPYHLAAMIRYIKQAYDGVQRMREREQEPG